MVFLRYGYARVDFASHQPSFRTHCSGLLRHAINLAAHPVQESVPKKKCSSAPTLVSEASRVQKSGIELFYSDQKSGLQRTVQDLRIRHHSNHKSESTDLFPEISVSWTEKWAWVAGEMTPPYGRGLFRF